MAENGRLTPKQQAAIAALLAAKDVRQAALLAGVPERTLFRWLALDDFRAALAREETRIITHTSRLLTAATAEAVQTMQDTMRDPNALPGVRLRASDLLLKNAREYREHEQLEERLARLEDIISEYQAK